MEIRDLELEAYVPLSIKLMGEAAPEVSVAAVAIVTKKRSDGGTELTVPQCHIYIDAEKKPVRAWTESKDVHVSELNATPYEIDLPLMPAHEEVDEKDKENQP